MKSLHKDLMNLNIIKVFFVAIVFLYFTGCKDIPTVSTSPVTNIETNQATTGGKVLDDGNASVKDRGVCWSPNISPTITNNKTADGSGMGSFTSSITQLTPNTLYHVRAFATNSEGTGYGNEVSFTTNAVTTVVPTLSTTAITSITQTTAVSGGNITSDGGATVTARGICWNTSSGPTTSNSNTSDGTGSGSFTSSMTGLTANTTYYVRAYATNSIGTAYGNEVTFTTNPVTTVAPTLTTTDITSITQTTASSGGNITSDGGASVTARGVCWNTASGPTTSNSKTSDGTGSGSFTSSMTGLTANTTYYVRAYATNSVSTAYGNEVNFKTDFICGTRLLDPRDGKTYLTVQIGNQCWFAENLNVGVRINGAADQTDNSVIEKYCYNDNESNCSLYGGLYQWDEMMQYSTIEMSQGVCPVGWHIPSDYEWKVLEMTLGMDQTSANAAGWRGTNEGGKLKAAGTTYWNSPNTGATNSSLFTAMPSGDRSGSGTYESLGYFTDFWTSTFIIDTQCWYRYLDADHSQIYRIDGNRKFGTAVRCVKD
ncbi:MAG: FISUMP domain-containing protein [Bacteroidales bacterium]